MHTKIIMGRLTKRVKKLEKQRAKLRRKNSALLGEREQHVHKYNNMYDDLEDANMQMALLREENASLKLRLPSLDHVDREWDNDEPRQDSEDLPSFASARSGNHE